MENDSTRPSSWLDEIEERAHLERERLTVQRAKLMVEVSRIDSELKRIGRLERAVAFEDAAKPAKSRSKSYKYTPSDEKLLKTAEAILMLNDEEFRVAQVAEQLGFPKGGEHVRKAVMELRRLEFIGKGKREKVNGSGMPTQHFRLLSGHEQVLDRLRERVNAD